MRNTVELLKDMTILYAEDDKLVRETTHRILNFFFKKVYVANDGILALEIYTFHKPSMLLLDVHMPGLSGIEVAKIVRQKDEKTPIIMNTGFKEYDDFLEAVKLNLVEFLIKPFTFEQLRLSLLAAVMKMEKNGMLMASVAEGLSYDFTKKIILNGESTIALTKNEVVVLEELLVSKGSLVHYSRLEERLGGEYDASKAAIKNIILRLRKKIGKEKIVNLQDLGYILV